MDKNGNNSKTAEPAARLAAIDDRQLKKMARRAKAQLKSRETESGQRSRRARKKRRQRRVFIWLLELAVLLAALEFFILTPRRVEREARERRLREAEAEPPGQGEELPELGEAADLPAGLREIAPAYSAALDGLASGSRSAQMAQLSYARDRRLPVEVENSVGMRFRLIPPGSFLMGSPESEPGRWEGEKQHVASVSAALYFGKFEVTQEQWQSVMGTSPSYFRGTHRPVEEVTWNDAHKFTLRLAEMEGLEPGAYRLPTEAEWEYAARAGTETAFVFGDDPRRLRHFAAYIGSSGGESQTVGRLRPNA